MDIRLGRGDIRGPHGGVVMGAGGVGVHPGLVGPHSADWALLQLQGLCDDVSPGAEITQRP